MYCEHGKRECAKLAELYEYELRQSKSADNAEIHVLEMCFEGFQLARDAHDGSVECGQDGWRAHPIEDDIISVAEGDLYA